MLISTKSDIAILIATFISPNSTSTPYDRNHILVTATRARQRIGNNVDVFLLVSSDAPDDAELAQHNVRLWRAALPLIPVDQRVSDEFRKLSAFLMRPYRRVVVIEPRVLLHRSLAELLALPPWVEIIFARGVRTPFQPAMFIVTPSPDVYALFEHARGFLTEGAPDFGQFVTWFFGHKRPLRASVPVSDCHYANSEEPFCSDTPSEQLSAFIFSNDRCPMTHCIANNAPSSGQLCRFASSEYMLSFADIVPNSEDLCKQ